MSGRTTDVENMFSSNNKQINNNESKDAELVSESKDDKLGNDSESKDDESKDAESKDYKLGNVAESKDDESKDAESKDYKLGNVAESKDAYTTTNDAEQTNSTNTNTTTTVSPVDISTTLEKYYASCVSEFKLKSEIVHVPMTDSDIASILPDLGFTKQISSELDGVKIVELIHNRINGTVEFTQPTTITFDPKKLIYRKENRVAGDPVVKKSLLTYLVELYRLSGKVATISPDSVIIGDNINVEDYVETDSALVYLTELKKYTWQSGVLANLYKSMLDTQMAIVTAAATSSSAATSVSTGTIEQGTIKGGKKTRRNKQAHLKRTFREH